MPFEPIQPLRVILAYKNFALNKAISHIGLGVTALNCAKVLRQQGICTEVWAVAHARQLVERISEANQEAAVTHVVVSAPWIATPDLAEMAAEFPEIQFAVVCHSNLGFLQADPGAMRLVREGIALEMQTWNFHVAANNERLSTWVTNTFGAPCTWLPNLYHLEGAAVPKTEMWRGGTLRIGAFGATRPLKNFLTAAGAALQIASQLHTDLEFWISSGRNEGAGPLVDAIRQMTAGLPHVKILENGWQSWPQFRQTVRHMHLLLQPSYTETFNVVTADGIAEGVPSVVSEAIEWAPQDWVARVDDVDHIARTGIRLLRDRRAARKGWKALTGYNRRAFEAWLRYL